MTILSKKKGSTTKNEVDSVDHPGAHPHQLPHNLNLPHGQLQVVRMIFYCVKMDGKLGFSKWVNRWNSNCFLWVKLMNSRGDDVV